VAGTRVQTADGPRAVETLIAGQLVVGKAERDEVVGNYAVRDVFRGVASTLYHVEVDGRLSLSATGSHPFFVVGKGWTRAKDLATGDRLVTPDRDTARVTNLTRERLAEPVATFNLRVDEAHNYFVGHGPAVLVHNGTPVDADVLKQGLIWGLGSGGPRQRLPVKADPSSPDPKLRAGVKGDLDGASGWRTGSQDEVGRLVGTRATEGATGNHGAITEAQLKSKGLVAVNTAGDGALAEAGFQHVSIRPESNPDPSVNLTDAEMQEVKTKLEELAPVAQNKAGDFLCV
jgi:hypothetical protein